MRRAQFFFCAFLLAALLVPARLQAEEVAPLDELPAEQAEETLDEAPVPEKRTILKSGEPFPFLDDALISGGAYFFARNRERYNMNKERYTTNLHHITGQVSAEFNSGWLAETIGLDVGAFGAYDFQNSGSPDHEMNFVPWSNPWSPDWSAKEAENGASLYKAQLRLQAGPARLKAGYFQPSGPGVLGVNWSFLPGTYLGGEAAADFGPVTVAVSAATRYKAPWYTDTYYFRKNDGTTRVDYLWSAGVGAKLLEDRLYLELAYGESQDYLKNAHAKASYTQAWNGQTLTLAYHLYAMGDSDNSGGVNDNFDGVALHHFAQLRYELDPWTFRLEALHTRAPQNNPNNVGYFAYRLISAYGGANGAYAPWWDLRSDWNHDNETAMFASISRTGADFGLPGLFAAVSAAYGWDGTAYGYSTHFAENAFGFEIGYIVQAGPLANSLIKLHYTDYNNRTNLPSWQGFKNAFQDERDIKFTVIIPF